MYNEVLEKTLISEEQLKTRISELAKQIEKDYEGKSPVIVGVLKGSVMFYTDLVRQIDLPLTVDFMSISSYGAGVNSTGEVKIIKDIDGKIGGKDVIIVEDIVDSGYSMNCLLKLFATRSPKSVRVCALLDKPSRREIPVPIDYTGFQVANEFVVGVTGLITRGFTEIFRLSAFLKRKFTKSNLRLRANENLIQAN